MKRFYIYLLAGLLLAAACNEKISPDMEATDGTQICFSIPQDLETKAPVFTDRQLSSGGAVYVHGTKSGTVMNHYNNAQLNFNSLTSLWMPTTSDTWEYGTDRGLSYSFWAYGINNVNATGASASLTTTGDNFGKSVTITQPAAYVHQNDGSGFGYDYLLSQVYNATSYKVLVGGEEAIRGPVVHLHMEHALALVDVRIKVHKDIYKVTLQGIELRDFARGGTLTCTSQADYGNSTGAQNRWNSITNNNGTVYSRGSVLVNDEEHPDNNTSELHVFAPGRDIEENELGLMLFTAIPQQMKTATITVATEIQEINGGPVHQLVQTWNLNNYYDWESGYRNVYTISIDTSSELDATILDWPVVNNVSGTILPKL